MSNSIFNYSSTKDYCIYLDSLDKAALLNEFYALHRLKEAIASRTEQICRTVYNDYCALLVDNYDDITKFDAYLLRVLLKFELFVGRQRQHIAELHDFYDPRPIRAIKPLAVFDADTVFRVYDEVVCEMRRLENIVSMFEEKTNMWLYFLYGRCDIPEVLKTEECRKKVCAVTSDGSYDFRYQLELVNNELVRIIETQMNCGISIFKDDDVEN